MHGSPGHDRKSVRSRPVSRHSSLRAIPGPGVCRASPASLWLACPLGWRAGIGPGPPHRRSRSSLGTALALAKWHPRKECRHECPCPVVTDSGEPVAMPLWRESSSGRPVVAAPARVGRSAGTSAAWCAGSQRATRTAPLTAIAAATSAAMPIASTNALLAALARVIPASLPIRAATWSAAPTESRAGSAASGGKPAVLSVIRFV